MTRLDALRNLAGTKPLINEDGSFTPGLAAAVLACNGAMRPTMEQVQEAIAADNAPNVSSIEDAFADALSSIWKAQHDLDAVNRQYQAERRRIAGVLATFAASPISAASLQPILDLAAEMNQEAK